MTINSFDPTGNEDRCIQRARKRLRAQKKFGRWRAAFCLIGSTAFIGFGVFFIVLIYRLLGALQQPQVQNAERLGFIVGVILGFISGIMFFKGALYLAEFISCLRGDRTDQLLVEYHDCLLSLAKVQATQIGSSDNTDQPAGGTDETG